MDERFLRNEMLWGKDGQARLTAAHVIVFGLGGVGSYVTECLARAGVGELTLVDSDTVALSNLNRQLLSEVSLLGVGKAQTAAERVRRVNPDVAVHAVGEFLTEENAAALLTDCDAVLDGLDNIQSRQILANACERAGIPLICGAVFHAEVLDERCNQP